MLSHEQYCNIRLGEPVVGVLKPTQSAERTLQLSAWSVASFDEWQLRSPRTFLEPREWRLNPDIVFDLPQLACREFRNSRNPDTVSFAQLFPPVFDGNNLRTLAEGAGSVQAVWEGDRSRVTRDPFHTTAQGRRPTAPTIHEDDVLSADMPKRPAQWGSEWGEDAQDWAEGEWAAAPDAPASSTRSADEPLTSVDLGRGGSSAKPVRSSSGTSTRQSPLPPADTPISVFPWKNRRDSYAHHCTRRRRPSFAALSRRPHIYLRRQMGRPSPTCPSG